MVSFSVELDEITKPNQHCLHVLWWGSQSFEFREVLGTDLCDCFKKSLVSLILANILHYRLGLGFKRLGHGCFLFFVKV